MKKILFFSALMFFTKLSWCAVGAPLDRQGHALQTIDWVGANPCSIDASTGTVAVLCGSAGRGVVYGVIVSSIVNTDFITFRDSATANLTSSTVAVVYANGSWANATGVATLTIMFPAPIRFLNGISVNDNTAPTAGNQSRWTILYRPLAATE